MCNKKMILVISFSFLGMMLSASEDETEGGEGKRRLPKAGVIGGMSRILDREVDRDREEEKDQQLPSFLKDHGENTEAKAMYAAGATVVDFDDAPVTHGDLQAFEDRISALVRNQFSLLASSLNGPIFGIKDGVATLITRQKDIGDMQLEMHKRLMAMENTQKRMDQVLARVLQLEHSMQESSEKMDAAQAEILRILGRRKQGSPSGGDTTPRNWRGASATPRAEKPKQERRR